MYFSWDGHVYAIVVEKSLIRDMQLVINVKTGLFCLFALFCSMRLIKEITEPPTYT